MEFTVWNKIWKMTKTFMKNNKNKVLTATVEEEKLQQAPEL